MRYIDKIYIPAILLAAFLTACTTTTREEGGDILVEIGEECLTVDELRSHLPAGLSEADSVRSARSYIRSWIDSRLISEIASKNIGDLTEIDRITREYRNELIAYEYRRRLADRDAQKKVPEDSVRAFFDKNRGNYKLERPLVKGVFIKLPDDAPQIREVRKLYRSDRMADIDRLEKQCLDRAVIYDFFRDRWVDWEQIESRIPMDFGPSANQFLRAHDHLEYTSGGFTYLLDVNDFCPAGGEMPFEYARERIEWELQYRNRADFDRELRRELLKEAYDDGKIQIFCDLDS